MAMETLSAADIAAVTDKNTGDGFMGGSWAWIIVLIVLLFGGRGFGNTAGATELMNGITNEFLYTNLNNTLNQGFTQVANQTFGIQKDLCQGFASTNQNICDVGFKMQQCCCETNRNIDAVRYENAKNTCDITTAIRADGEATRALITQNVMQELRDQLQDAKNSIVNTAQTQTLIGALKPFPVPAYVTCSPYQSANYFNGCGGCGCA